MVVPAKAAENSSKSANASPNKYDIEKMGFIVRIFGVMEACLIVL